VGENPNDFYRVEKLQPPVISSVAAPTLSQLPNTWLYDIQTSPGKIYTLTSK
jgi:alpha-L-fucosidase 2